MSSKFNNNKSLLCGSLKWLLHKLERVQNAAAWLVSLVKKYDHITLSFYDIHWPPVPQQIYCKILLPTFKVLYGKLNLLVPDNDDRNLCSNKLSLLVCPRSDCVLYSDQAFCSCSSDPLEHSAFTYYTILKSMLKPICMHVHLI